MARAGAGIADATRKREDYKRLVNLAKEKLQAECVTLGISGHDPKVEIKQLSRELRPTLARAAECCASAAMKEAIDLYRQWTAFCFARMADMPAPTKSNKGAAAKATPAPVRNADEVGSSRLVVLARAHASGRMEAGVDVVGPEAETRGAGEIDWPGDGSGHGADAGTELGGEAVEIDWGNDGAGNDGSGAALEIDWGNDGAGNDGSGEAVEIDWGGAEATAGEAAEIDWGVDVQGETDAELEIVSHDLGTDDGAIEVELSGETDGTDRKAPTEAQYEDAASRNELLDDLMEVWHPSSAG